MAVVTTPGSSAASGCTSLTLLWSTTWRREMTQMAAQEPTRKSATAATPRSPVRMTSSAPEATTAAAGRVRPQAMNMRVAVDQRTTPPLRPRPAPMTAPEHAWVVEREKPRLEEARMTLAAEVWAAKPCCGCRSVRPLPMVRMMRQPPREVPSAMARPAETMTHTGGLEPGASAPPATSARVMMPIVFCASLVPCARETRPAEAIWPAR